MCSQFASQRSFACVLPRLRFPPSCRGQLTALLLFAGSANNRDAEHFLAPSGPGRPAPGGPYPGGSYLEDPPFEGLFEDVGDA